MLFFPDSAMMTKKCSSIRNVVGPEMDVIAKCVFHKNVWWIKGKKEVVNSPCFD